MATKDKDEVECKALTTDEKEEVLKESKKSLPRRVLNRTSSKGSGKGFDKETSKYISKDEFSKYKKLIDGEFKNLSKMIESLIIASNVSASENLDVVIKSLNDTNRRIDAFDAKLKDSEKNASDNIEDGNIREELSELEDEVGGLSDKIDILFIGDEDDSIQSRVEKLEQNLYGRLHGKAANVPKILD